MANFINKFEQSNLVRKIKYHWIELELTKKLLYFLSLLVDIGWSGLLIYVCIHYYENWFVMGLIPVIILGYLKEITKTIKQKY